jgi:putative ABC transport system permease protein
MFKNYFKIAIRQLRKQKMYSAVKIGGFAFSIAACLLIALYIRDELSYDKSYPDQDRIYRLLGEYNANGVSGTGADWPAPTAKAIKTDYPEVEHVGRLMPHELFYGAGSNEIRRTDQVQDDYEDKFTYADQGILDILKLPMIYGDRAHALTEPHTMVISRAKAEKYFPNENPVGKTMILNDDKNRIYTIKGVIPDWPTTSHLHYDWLLTLSGNEFWNGEQDSWMASNYYTYLSLRPGTNVAQFEDKLKSIVTKYYVPALEKGGYKDADKFAQQVRLFIQPVAAIHLHSYKFDDGLPHGDIRFVWLFGAIAAFILIIACINFINLSTAKSANRAKEVGLRKALGSLRSSLMQQFLVESLLFSVFSFLLGILIAWAFLPAFNEMAGKSLSIPWASVWLIPVMIGSAAVIGIFAGIYPSIYLSSFKPINTLKGELSRGSKNSFLRNGLVVFQFSTSIILIISTFVIYNQMHYILNTRLGFDKDQVLLIQGANTLGDKEKDLRNELLKLSSVKSVTLSDYLPVSGTKRDMNTFYKEGKTKEDAGTGAQHWYVDDAYIRTMGMKIVSGRNFSPVMPSDSQATVINQAMAIKMGLKDPLGKRITNGWQTFTVIGVVEDFNYESMRNGIEPLCMCLGRNSSIISVKMNTADIQHTLASVQALWKTFAPAQPIRYTFLDESFANMYADVRRMTGIFTGFAVLAILIACLGLFGLSAYMAEQRNKEIGIRKVLGASVGSIVTMLSKDFVRLVGIAILIATPIAWWAMNKWLEDFTYRIHPGPGVFLIAGGIAVLIALATISFQSVKAAWTNPAKSLRSE